jgi:hypothetical protein
MAHDVGWLAIEEIQVERRSRDAVGGVVYREFLDVEAH